MTLHIPTLFVALFAAFALLALALAFAQRVLGQSAGFQHWARGSWALVAGFTALSSRAVMPEWFAVLAGNGLVILSLLQFSRALYRFIDDAEAPRWNIVLAGAAWAVVASVLSWPLHQRTSVVSALMAMQLAPSVWLIAKHGWHAERSLRTVALAFAITMIALVVRAVHAWTHAADYSGFFQSSLGNGITYLMAFLFPLGAGFGFLLASLERAARRMEELATHDSLTGCVNRAHFDSLLAHEWQRAQHEGSALSLALIDLDHFKRTNDEHGHRTGDDVLRAFAAAVRTRLRTSDIFGRVGGEEFGVVLPAADAAGAMHLAEEVRAAVAALQVRSRRGALVSVTASVGVCTVRGDPLLTEDEFFARADRALYAVKRRGRDGVAHSDEVPALQAG